MKFSDVFEITGAEDEDWFDPVLSIDTPLFVDPFLIYADDSGEFAGAHAEVITFFNFIYKWIAAAGGDTEALSYRKALDSLLFPEFEELCLGYSAAGTRGSGSGHELATIMAAAVWEAVQAGITEITHFEQVGILREGIGADRISDLTAGFLKARLATYTAAVCQKHGITTEPVRYTRGVFDPNLEVFRPISAQLPRNPYNGKAAMLVPRRYLKDLPSINPSDFWEFCYSNENATLRTEFSYDVARRVNKSEIVALARRHPEFVQRYLEAKEEKGSQPYDIERDSKGAVQWYEATRLHCESRPLAAVVQSEGQFTEAVRQMVLEFRHYVEQNEGWRLLWNDNRTSKGEEAAQHLFLGIIKHYCRANNIDVTKEATIGRGPVDFKVSAGYQLRTLLELKLARNTKFWHGLTEQLPTYLAAEQINSGYFIVVLFNEEDARRRLPSIQETVAAVNTRTGLNVQAVIVDVRRGKRSASKV